MVVHKLLSVAEVAAHLGVRRGRVYELISGGCLRAVRIGERQLRVRPEDLESMLAGGPGKATGDSRPAS